MIYYVPHSHCPLRASTLLVEESHKGGGWVTDWHLATGHRLSVSFVKLTESPKAPMKIALVCCSIETPDQGACINRLDEKCSANYNILDNQTTMSQKDQILISSHYLVNNL